jgi:hypothetical protein
MISLQTVLGVTAFVSVIGLQFLVSRNTTLLKTDRYHLRRKVQHFASGVLIVIFAARILSRSYAIAALVW